MSKFGLQGEAPWKFSVLELHVDMFNILLLGCVVAKPRGSIWSDFQVKKEIRFLL